MASRDRYNIDIICSSCGEKCVIGISENDYIHMSKDRRAVDYVEGNFNASMKDQNTVKISCKNCGKDNFYP